MLMQMQANKPNPTRGLDNMRSQNFNAKFNANVNFAMAEQTDSWMNLHLLKAYIPSHTSFARGVTFLSLTSLRGQLIKFFTTLYCNTLIFLLKI